MVDVLRNMVAALVHGGLVLDLQVIRPNPIVDSAGRDICDVDGEPLFRRADAATAAVDDLVARGELVEQAVDDHLVRKHYPSGSEVVADFDGKERTLPSAAVPLLCALDQPCTMRETCRLRRLVVTGESARGFQAP